MSNQVEQIREKLQKHIDVIKTDLDADIITMYLYDIEHGRPFLATGAGLRDSAAFRRGIPDLNRAVGEVIRVGTPIFADNVLNHPNLIGPFVYREGVRSVALLPVKKTNGELMGLIYINYRQLTPFDDEVKQKILDRVKELSTVVEKEITSYTKDTPLYRQIAPVESQTRIEIILHQSVGSVRNSLGSFSIALWMPNEKGELTLEHGSNIHSRFIGEHTPLNSLDFIASAFNSQQKTRVETIKGSKNFLHKDIAKALRWRAALAIPLIAPNYRSPLGVLCAYTIDHLIITPSEETILESFATSISAQIESDRRYKSLNLMNELGASLLQTLNLNEIKRRIVEVTTTITQADLCVLHLYDAVKKQFLPRSQSAILIRDKVEVRLVERPRESGLSAHILARGWYELEDVSKLNKNLTLSSFFQDEGIQALLGVRLEAQNQPLGVLIVGFRKQRVFTVDESTIVRSLSYFATLAIVQAQSYEQRLSFARASNRITKARNRDELLRDFLEDCLKLTNSEQGAVGTVNYRTGEIDITHSINQKEGFSVPAGQGLMAMAVETRMSVLVNNVGRHPRYYRVDPNVKSELDVPLMVENRVIGVLNAKSTRPDAYNEEHEEMLLELADEAAAALYRFNLDDRIRHRADLSRKIAEARDQNELLGTALNGMADLIGSETNLYATVNRLTGGIHMAQRGSEQLSGWDVPEGKGLTRLAVKTGSYVYVGNVKTDPEFKDIYVNTHDETLTEFDIPLRSGEKTIGVLSFQSPRENAFTEEDIETALAVAVEVAVALNRFNLQERLRVTDEFGEELTSGVRLEEEEILQLIHEKIIAIVETNHMYIAMFDEPKDTIRFSLVYEEGKPVDIEQSDRWQPRRGGKGRTERIIESGQPVIVRTVDQAREWRGKPDTQEYEKTFWRSWIGVPMRVGKKTFGVIVAYNPEQEGFFDTDDLQILQSIGNKAAIALDNARLHFNLNQRLGTLTRVTNELTKDIFRTDLEIVERIYGFLKEVVITENMYIALYDKSIDTVHFPLVYAQGLRVDTENYPVWEPRKGGRGRTEWIIKNRQQIFISSKQEAEEWYDHPDRKEYIGTVFSSWLGVPMFIGERVFGVIALYHDIEEYVYNSDDVTVVQSLADLGAVLLDNARLYREARSEAVAAKQLATLGTAMALIQHRINNSFNLITPNVRRLRKRVDKKDETATEILDIIDRNAAYAAKMIDEIQVKLKNVEEKQPVDVNRLLNEVLTESLHRWEAESQNGKIHIQHRFGEGIPEINAPVVQIDELLTNLVDNAYRAMNGKGTLVVSTELSNNNVLIRVKDSGKGIPEEVLERLFKKPIANSTLERTDGGTGLGLWLNSLSLGTIGGTIEVESTGKDGSTFLVKIPIQ